MNDRYCVDNESTENFTGPWRPEEKWVSQINISHNFAFKLGWTQSRYWREYGLVYLTIGVSFCDGVGALLSFTALITPYYGVKNYEIRYGQCL